MGGMQVVGRSQPSFAVCDWDKRLGNCREGILTAGVTKRICPAKAKPSMRLRMIETVGLKLDEARSSL